MKLINTYRHNLWMIMALLLAATVVPRDGEAVINLNPDPEKCVVKSTDDNKSLDFNFRSAVDLFNGSAIPGSTIQSCTAEILFDVEKVYLSKPIVLEGAVNPSVGFLFGAKDTTKYVTLITDNMQYTNADRCVVTIRGSASKVTLRNIIIKGKNKSQPLDGICVETQDNVVNNVQVGEMGRQGISITGKKNTIKGNSVFAHNGGPGIYTTVPYTDNNDRNFFAVNTFAFANNSNGLVLTPHTTSATPSDNTPSAQPATPSTTGGECSSGQQICVAGDKTWYKYDHFGSTSPALGQLIVTGNADTPVISGNTFIIIYKADPGKALGDNITLTDMVQAVIVQGDTPEVRLAALQSIDASLVSSGVATVTTGVLDATTGFFELDTPITSGEIFLQAFPTKDSLVSSSGIMALAGETQQTFLFANNQKPTCVDGSTDPLCQGVDGTTGSGSFSGGSGGGNGFGGGTSTASGKIGEDLYVWGTPGYETKLQEVLNNKQKACNSFQTKKGKEYPEQYDSDGDGIPDGLEDVTRDCTYQDGAETNLFHIDSDGDGLTDHQEDKNANGFVDCIVKVAGTTLVLKPIPLGLNKTTKKACNILDNDPTVDPPVLPCTPFKPISGQRVPDPSTLGLTFGLPDGQSKEHHGTPTYVFTGTATEDLDPTEYAPYTFQSGDVLICDETDPRDTDSDGDGLGDNEEDVQRYIDLTGAVTLRYEPFGVEVTDASSAKIDCSSEIEYDISGFTARRYLPAVAGKSLAWVVCESSALDKKSDYNTVPNTTDGGPGETNPREWDTDGDTISDVLDTCPTKDNTQFPDCDVQCFRGWRRWELGHMASVSVADSNEDKQSKLQVTREQILALKGEHTMEARKQLDALFDNIPSKLGGLSGDNDKDNIPDLIEAGIVEALSGTGSDCSNSLFVMKTSPFKQWTDEGITVSGNEFKDYNDPCPGVDEGKKEKDPIQKDYTCMEVKPSYHTLMPIASCYVDRDNDGLYDCEEDTNLNGQVEVNELSPLKASSNDSGVNDADLKNKKGVCPNIDPKYANPLIGDSDGDGIPDILEVKGNSFVPQLKVNYGTCSPEATGNVMKSSEQFWDLPKDPAWQKLGAAMEFNGDTDPCNPDTDGDGINDLDEIIFGYSPTNADSDGDGACDGPNDVSEAKCAGGVGPDARGEDQNGDGVYPFFTVAAAPLTNMGTLAEGNPGESNPCDPDTDHVPSGDANDKCKNVQDLNCKSPNVVGTDSDGDHIPDITEVTITGTDPFPPFGQDTDKDGLSDGCLIDEKTGEPIMGSGELCNQMKFGQYLPSFDQLNSPDCGKAPYTGCDTNPHAVDTDNDGMNDKQERTYPTNPIVKDTDGDCIADGLEDTHFTKQADGSYAIIPGSIDGTFAGCNDVPAGDAGIGKICTETHADNWDTDGDQLADGNIGNVGEDLDCNGVQNLEVGTLLALETSPKTWDTDADGESDYSEMTRFGGFNISQNLSRATSGRSGGCSLTANDHTATRSADLVLLLMLVGLPLAVLTRTRKLA